MVSKFRNDKVQSTLNGLSPHHTCHLLAGIFAEAVPGEHRQFWRLLDLAPMWSTVMSNPTWLLQSKKYEDWRDFRLSHENSQEDKNWDRDSRWQVGKTTS